MVVRQETSFPESDQVRLSLKCRQPISGTVKIRYPRWVTGPMVLAVNGKPQVLDGLPGDYVSLTREWQDGDVIEVRLPLGLRVEKLPGEEDLIALFYGPIVLAGELGKANLAQDYARGQTDLVRVPSPEVPVFVSTARNLNEHTTRVPGRPLAFRTHDVGRPDDVTLAPFYQIHHQRYSVYWRLLSPAGWEDWQAKKAAEEARRKELVARMRDSVTIGDPQSEADHQLDDIIQRGRSAQNQIGL